MGLLLLLALASCKKEFSKNNLNAETEINSVHTANISIECEQRKHESLVGIATIFANTASTSNAFKEVVYNACLGQRRGDYDVRVSEILESNSIYQFWTTAQATEIAMFIDRFMCDDTTQPIVLIPHLENVNPSTYVSQAGYPTGAPIVCYGDEYNDNDSSYPSYVLNNSLLTFYEAMYEFGSKGAWQKDVWVFNEEEVVSPGNDVAAVGDTLTNFSDDLPPSEMGIVRIDGREEYGGYVQVQRVRKIEPWSKGKLEFKYFINQSSGALIKELAFGRWRRSNFENKRWHNFEDFIGTWNQSNWGSIHLERWIEEDGGSSASLSSSFSYNGLSVTVSHPSRSIDDDLGATTVQFSELALPEPGVTTYSLRELKFRRETRP